MSVTYGDRVQETFTTTGTGTISLGGAVTGYQAFSAIVANAATCYYTMTDGTAWEVGLGTYATAGNTLARTTVIASSNANAAVNWSAGTKNVWLDFPAFAAQNAINKVNIQTFLSSGTYTPTAGFVFGISLTQGSGGAGGGAAAANGASGAGGGAGGWAIKFLTAATVGASQTVTIGASATGVSAAAGNNGNATSIGTLCVAGGGTGGGAGTAASGGLGTPGSPGIGTTGDIVGSGDPGGSASTPNVVVDDFSGAGGNSLFGGAGKSLTGNTAAAGNAGAANTGSGGGGADTTGAAQLGGASGSGIAFVIEFCIQ